MPPELYERAERIANELGTRRASRASIPAANWSGELLQRARDDDHVAVTAPTIMEVTRGREAAAQADERMHAALACFVR